MTDGICLPCGDWESGLETVFSGFSTPWRREWDGCGTDLGCRGEAGMHLGVLGSSPRRGDSTGAAADLVQLCSVCWSLSRVRLLVTPQAVARQAPLSMGVSRQEYWSGLPCPPPGHLPDPGIKPRSPALHEDSLPSEPQGKQVGFS